MIVYIVNNCGFVNVMYSVIHVPLRLYVLEWHFNELLNHYGKHKLYSSRKVYSVWLFKATLISFCFALLASIYDQFIYTEEVIHFPFNNYEGDDTTLILGLKYKISHQWHVTDWYSKRGFINFLFNLCLIRSNTPLYIINCTM